MREKFYGLLREYSATIRERDQCDEKVHMTPEGAEREQARRELEFVQKRCSMLRKEIKHYPDFSAKPGRAGANNPDHRYQAQAS